MAAGQEGQHQSGSCSCSWCKPCCSNKPLARPAQAMHMQPQVRALHTAYLHVSQPSTNQPIKQSINQSISPLIDQLINVQLCRKGRQMWLINYTCYFSAQTQMCQCLATNVCLLRILLANETNILLMSSRTTHPHLVMYVIHLVMYVIHLVMYVIPVELDKVLWA